MSPSPGSSRQPIDAFPARRRHQSPADTALGAFVRAIRSHPLLILAAIGVALAACVWSVRAPTYEASAEILVTPLPAADRSLIVLPLPREVADPGRPVNTAAAIVESREAAGLAAARLGEGTTTQSVAGAVEVSADADSNVVLIAATSGDPETAARIANEYARAALDIRSDELRPLIEAALERSNSELARVPPASVGVAELLRTRIADLRALRGGVDPTLSLAEPASVPQAPTGPSRMLLFGLALVGGAIIGLAAAVLVELLVARRLDAADDLKELYPLPVLARVPIQVGGPPPYRAAVPALTDGYRALRVRLDAHRDVNGREAERGTTVLVSGGARREGRTTTALELARAIARTQQSALVLDLDLEHPSVSEFLEVAPARDLSDALLGRATLAETVTPVDLQPGLSIIAAPRGADASLVDLLSVAGPDLLSEARALSDWVIIDAPPITEAGAILSMASEWDQVVLVSWLGKTDAAALARARELLESLELSASGHVAIGPDRVEWHGSQNGSGSFSRAAGARPVEPR
jgi:polysaccharide biosynthesis transport protein